MAIRSSLPINFTTHAMTSLDKPPITDLIAVSSCVSRNCFSSPSVIFAVEAAVTASRLRVNKRKSWSFSNG